MLRNSLERIRNDENLEKYFEDIDSDDEVSKVNSYNKKKNTRSIIYNCGCDNCDLIEDCTQGMLLCQNCGQIVGEILDHSPEWKQYEDSDMSNARCGAPINMLLPQSSMGTTIGGNARPRIKMIQRWDAMPYKERSLNGEFKKINNICVAKNIPKSIEEDTKIMCKMASEVKHKTGENAGKSVITRGKNRISISAACMYFACLKKNMAYTSKEIAEFYGISYSEINNGIKTLRELIDTQKILRNNSNCNQNQFIKRYCDNLKMFNIHSDEAIRIANNVEKLGIATEHNSYSHAAACILFVIELYDLKYISKKTLATEFGISEATLTKTYKKIEQYKNIIVDNDKVDKAKENMEKTSMEKMPDSMMEKMKKFDIELNNEFSFFNNSNKK